MDAPRLSAWSSFSRGIFRALPDLTRLYVSGVALALLLSPLSWLNYFVLVIPALIILSSSLDLADIASHRVGLAVLTGDAAWVGAHRVRCARWSSVTFRPTL